MKCPNCGATVAIQPTPRRAKKKAPVMPVGPFLRWVRDSPNPTSEKARKRYPKMLRAALRRGLVRHFRGQVVKTTPEERQKWKERQKKLLDNSTFED